MFGDNLLFECLAISFVSILMAILFFFIGIILDPVMRAKILRMLTKRNYTLLCIVSEDGKGIKTRLVNPENGSITVGNKIWILDKNYIYRQDKSNDGFLLGGENVRYTEGVPCVFVSERDVKPLPIGKWEHETSPEAVGSILNAWIINQYAKGMAKIRTAQLLAIVSILLILVNCLIGYVTYGQCSNSYDLEVQNRDTIAQLLNTTTQIVSNPSCQRGIPNVGG
jgi:hypothetical protein